MGVRENTGIEIYRHVLDDLIAHARDESPNECCGLLIGRDTRTDRRVVEEGVRTTNARRSPTAFLIDPEEHFATIRRVRAEGRTIVGAYHSHPRSPAIPSPTDLNEAYYPDFVYLIVSLQEAEVQVRGYVMDGGNFVRVALVALPAASERSESSRASRGWGPGEQ